LPDSEHHFPAATLFLQPEKRFFMKILISGSLAYDRIMDFPGKFADHILPEKLHILNVCFTVTGMSERFGGTAGNIAYSLSLLGERPLILATAGKDFDTYRAWLEGHGLPTDGIRPIPDEFTASAYITTDKADNQITGFNPGAMRYPSKYAFDGIRSENAIAIISPGNVEDMITYSRTYRELGIPYICDPGQQIPIISPEELAGMISGAAILISNDYELEMIRQKTGMDDRSLLEAAPVMITTLGEKGAQVTTPEGIDPIPAVPVREVKDPTGAGDAFRAGLLKGLTRGETTSISARIGATCASYAVEHLGTQEHRFTEETFWRRHREAFGE
jgi:adenosine kinase